MVYRTREWEAAAQEAAFEGLCFCMICDGRFVNRQAMPDQTPHRSRFALASGFISEHIALTEHMT